MSGYNLAIMPEEVTSLCLGIMPGVAQLCLGYNLAIMPGEVTSLCLAIMPGEVASLCLAIIWL